MHSLGLNGKCRNVYIISSLVAAGLLNCKSKAKAKKEREKKNWWANIFTFGPSREKGIPNISFGTGIKRTRNFEYVFCMCTHVCVFNVINKLKKKKLDERTKEKKCHTVQWQRGNKRERVCGCERGETGKKRDSVLHRNGEKESSNRWNSSCDRTHQTNWIKLISLFLPQSHISFAHAHTHFCTLENVERENLCVSECMCVCAFPQRRSGCM